MKTVLVTGCGGAVGQGIVKSLLMGSDDLRLIGVDSDPYTACFLKKTEQKNLQKAHVVPNAGHPKYFDKMTRICRCEEVDVVFPGTDAELETLASSRDKLSKFGVKIVVSPLKTIQTCRDKWLTYSILHKHLPIVCSAIPDDGLRAALEFCGLPAVIKPRSGWGSRDLYKAENLEEALIFTNRIQRPIIQELLEGEEYTVDGLIDKHGKATCIIPRRRIKVLAGVSVQGITVRDDELIELGKEVAKHIEIEGPFNYQAIKTGDGKTRIIEINPRFAGTGILSVKAGANIPFLAVCDALNLKPPRRIDFKEGLIISRYFEEAVIDVNELHSLKGEE